MSVALLDRVGWVFIALGMVGVVVYARTPDIHVVPQAVLIGGTGLFGGVVLKVLARLLREPEEP